MFKVKIANIVPSGKDSLSFRLDQVKVRLRSCSRSYSRVSKLVYQSIVIGVKVCQLIVC